MKKSKELSCSYSLRDPKAKKQAKQASRSMYSSRKIQGYELNGRIRKTIFNVDAENLTLIVMVHVVGRGQPAQPIVSQDWIDELFSIANEIWAQACVRLGQVYTEDPITEFLDVALSGFINCLPPENINLVAPYEVKTPNHKIVNLFLVRETNGIACANPFSGRIFLPTTRSITRLGRTLAHEVGHLLLNPQGVDDSDNPKHLMYHGTDDPNTPIDQLDGLFLSECLGARETLEDEYLFFRGAECTLTPRLGNNLALVATEFARG